MHRQCDLHAQDWPSVDQYAICLDGEDDFVGRIDGAKRINYRAAGAISLKEKIVIDAANRQRLLLPEDQEAEAYWADKEFKKFAVTVTAGPAKRPTFRDVIYVQTKTADRAIECAKGRLSRAIRGARFSVKLATARELGCVCAVPHQTGLRAA